ncbi:MAG TPA: glycosyltransferase family 4 protein [Acidimicrobiales bacterium]|jgi:colanic acid biosynthesis glycosyl transferase WcaI
MRLLVICPHYAPDVAPTGEVMTSIGTELVRRGHELHVVTALPWYEHHRVEPEWRGRPVRHEEVPWGQVTRVHPFPTDKRNIPARALAFAGFTVLASVMSVAGKRRFRPDGVLAMSPPLTLGVAGWMAARRWRVPYVFNIQDVFPDVAVELGAIRNPAVIKAASWLERWSYRRADAVTVLSDDLHDNLVAKLAGRVPDPEDRVRVIPNFVDTDRIRPRDPATSVYRREQGLEGRKVVMYAGNVGLSQSLDLMLAAARALQDRPDVVFVINGGGSARAALERQAEGLRNLRFVDFQPKERLPDVLAAADIHVVPLKRGLARSSVPSKTYSILAAGRPMVASVDEGTEVARVVERAGAGLAVPPEDPDAFVAAITKLVDSPEMAAQMGRSGRALVERWASPAAVALQYELLFEELQARP